jgi:lambda repressor-like predicted transcriptional regulator
MGRTRVLTDAQVQRILTWHKQVQAWNEQRKEVPTLRAFARVNRMDPRTLSRWLPTLDQKIELIFRARSWHRAIRKLLAARAELDTLRGLAREFGVSDNTIQNCIRRKGKYKQASPELLATTRVQRRARLDRLRRMNLY